MKITVIQKHKQDLRKLVSESMSFVDVLERIYNKTRSQHNTAALIGAAKRTKGVIITHTHKWADELTKQGVTAMHYSDPRIWTYDGPVLMDLPTMFEFVKAQARLAHKATELLDFMDLKNID